MDQKMTDVMILRFTSELCKPILLYKYGQTSMEKHIFIVFLPECTSSNY